ncbi:hypothetical protein HZA43_04535 [Candidatus Peregrinibacteria bacterium]|nr:hypothetical protein [Candidatus Peregrinibacteria bacterium]
MFKRHFYLLSVMVATGILLACPVVFAAELNWIVDTTVTLNGFGYTIKSGSAATNLTVGATTLTVQVPGGSTFTLYSGNGHTLTNNGSITGQCAQVNNQWTNQIAVTGPVTVTVTPSTLTCTPPPSGSATHSGGSSEGGGGGGDGETLSESAVIPLSPPAEKEKTKEIPVKEDKLMEKEKEALKCEPQKKKMSVFSSASDVLRFAGKLIGRKEPDYRKKLIDAADFNGDGEFNIRDLIMLIECKGKK